MEELQFNTVAMKFSNPKVLRLNLVGSPKKKLEGAGLVPSEPEDSPGGYSESKDNTLYTIRGPVVTPSSSPELGTPSLVSSSDPGTSPFSNPEVNGDLKKEESSVSPKNTDMVMKPAQTVSEKFKPSIGQLWIPTMDECLVQVAKDQSNWMKIHTDSMAKLKLPRTKPCWRNSLHLTLKLE